MNSLLQFKVITRNLLTLLVLSMPLLVGAADTEVLKDPTMPLLNTLQGNSAALSGLQKEKEQKISLVLQGIVTKSGQKFAVINGQVLSQGQSIEGYKLTDIKGYGVELQGAQEEISLTLHKVNIKDSNE